MKNKAVFFALLMALPSVSAEHGLLSRHAFFLREFSPWEGTLNAIYRDRLQLEPGSAEIKDYITKLTDGVRGSVAGFPGDFLLFDGSRAEFSLQLLPWSQVSELEFQAVEIAQQSRARVKLTCERSSWSPAPSFLRRELIDSKGALQIVKYRARFPVSCAGAGKLKLSYDHGKLPFVFIDEIVLDTLSNGRPLARSATLNVLDDWKRSWQGAEEARLRSVLRQSPRDLDLFKALLGAAPAPAKPRLVYWQRSEAEAGFAVVSFLLHVDNTGSPILDLVRGMVFLPASSQGSLPLVLLNHQGTKYGYLETGAFLGRSEMGWAPPLARHGVAVLLLESILHNQGAELSGHVVADPSPKWREGQALYSYYPNWSISGKELSNQRAALDFVMSPLFASLSDKRVDPKQVAVAGFSYGAWNSLLLALYEPRVKVLAMSHLEDYSAQWRDFAEALYVPQLSLLDPKNFPLHVCRLLQQSPARQVLVSVGEGALAKHYGECLDDKGRERIRVLVNPIGKVLTFPERAEFLAFLTRSLGRPELREAVAPAQTFRGKVEEAVQRDNTWRNLVIEAMKGG